MRKALIIYSKYEPYCRPIQLLKRALKNIDIQSSSISVEDLTLASLHKNLGALIIPCTNAPAIHDLINVAASFGVKMLNVGIGSVARNRLTSNSTLQKVGLPVPEFWVGLNISELYLSIPESAYPVVKKDLYLPGQPTLLFRDSEELRHHIASNYKVYRANDSILYVEKFISNLTSYLKVYVCGTKSAIYKKFTDSKITPEPIPQSPYFNSITRKIRKELNLDFFSVDIIEEDFGAWIIDVNTFPIYKYHPLAYEWLANMVRQWLET